MTRRRLLSLTIAALCLVTKNTKAQAPFNTIDSININRINAAALVHGDLWWNPATPGAQCSYPNGSGINIAITGGLWMSGYDAGSNLHIAAQTYRQRGTDFWPGPLDASDTLTYANSQKWAKIWKLKRTEIQAFQALSATGSATPSNTAAAIWQWPARGNANATGNAGAALTITDDMAPFTDLNANGIYEPQLGDYPDVKGDQALWWVFSDNGPTHTETNGTPLKTEIHAMAYAYNRGGSIDNVIYYQYTIKNKSANTYSNFRVGQLADMDLGGFNDDYIGFDSTRGMGISYNADTADDLYGTSLPMTGLILRSSAGVASFMYYINNSSPVGYPVTAGEHNNYLRSAFRDSTHAINDFTGANIATTGYGTGTPTQYVYPGNPADNTQWSECSSTNPTGDRRFVIASGDMTLNAGASVTVNMILVATPFGIGHACGSTIISFADIQHVADTAIAVLDAGGLPPMPNSVTNTVAGNAVRIYPNPARDAVYIEHSGRNTDDAVITVYNIMGQAVYAPQTKNGATYKLDISSLPAGLYNMLYRNGNAQTSAKFIRE